MPREGRVTRELAVGIVSVFLMALTGGCSTYASKNFNVFLGTKNMDENDWGSLEKHTEFGLKFDFQKPEGSICLALDLFSSSEEQTTQTYDSSYGTINNSYEASTSELAFGVRKIWGSDVIHPFLGGGLAFVSASIDWSSETEAVFCDLFCANYLLGYGFGSDEALGFWLDGGVYLTLNERINIGLNMRWSKAEVTFYNDTVEAGGIHYGILTGFHF